ncbi:hypothetical protein [Clostridium sp. Ade.TY]|uniref:hypothetical protein n=1 Tax=Clostridium sp. Ade.TY TaxID=1391647 RepID=UPI0004278F05|nr:hypothetical protein [Clostridium sp. Ade.TY]
MEWWLLKNKIKEKLDIENRLYRCEYCGVYSIKADTYFLFGKSFCCKDCRTRWENEVSK